MMLCMAGVVGGLFALLLAIDARRARRAEDRSNRIMDEWAAHERKLKELRTAHERKMRELFK